MFRAARVEQGKLIEKGAVLKRVRIDAELKREVARASETARVKGGKEAADAARVEKAAELGLPVKAGKVEYPDAQLEYDLDGRSGRVNVEIATEHYSTKSIGAKAAEQVLMTRRNILVSGGTGSGKTTLLNALIELLPVDERIVAIEDTLELRIDHSNCVRFEARGLQEGAVTIRALVRHALRHRPDHIVVGEVRGGEAADLLQALNTGHGGSLTTVHANNAESALSRIASCAMQGGGELPWEVTCRGVVDGIAMVIHMTRREGRRFVEEAAFVQGYEAGENRWVIQPVWPSPEAQVPPGEASRAGRNS